MHNLDLIKGLDIEQLPDVEKWGEDYIAHLTATMQEMYGEDIMAALPEDRIKPAMQGVSTSVEPPYFLLNSRRPEAFSKIL